MDMLSSKLLQLTLSAYESSAGLAHGQSFQPYLDLLHLLLVFLYRGQTEGIWA
jgi:hypothetical protein